MKYKICLTAAVLLATATLAFAVGQQEIGTVSGQVVSMTTATDGNTTITVASGGKTYSITVPPAALTGLNVAVGQAISVKGVEHQNTDGSSTVDAESIESDGVSHDISPQGSNSGPEVSDNPGQSAETSHETPEASEPSGGGSSHQNGHETSGSDSGGGDD